MITSQNGQIVWMFLAFREKTILFNVHWDMMRVSEQSSQRDKVFSSVELNRYYFDTDLVSNKIKPCMFRWSKNVVNHQIIRLLGLFQFHIALLANLQKIVSAKCGHKHSIYSAFVWNSKFSLGYVQKFEMSYPQIIA